MGVAKPEVPSAAQPRQLVGSVDDGVVERLLVDDAAEVGVWTVVAPLTRVAAGAVARKILPDVKVRGTAQHIAEKYRQLARDAQSSGDPVMAESYLQHAEHYYRLIAAAMAAQQAASAPADEWDADQIVPEPRASEAPTGTHTVPNHRSPWRLSARTGRSAGHALSPER